MSQERDSPEQTAPLTRDARTEQAADLRVPGGLPSLAVRPDPSPDRYEDRGRIGIGGMGEVRRVYDRKLGRVLAMKIVQRGGSSDGQTEERAARMLDEARLTAALTHPGVVAVHDVGRLQDGRLWFTMKEVQGRTLETVIAEVHAASASGAWRAATSGWTFRRLVSALERAAQAVAYAHAAGVVHRDLKPQNLMVGAFGEVLVMDWGLARPAGAAAEDLPDRAREWRSGHAQTEQGAVLGTPAYMPPEQAEGDRERIGPKSDVYSLGAILYQILTGRPPYVGPSGRAVWQAVLEAAPDPPEAVVGPDHPPIPGELSALCGWALSRDPASRPAEAGVFAEALAAWLNHEGRRDEALALVKRALELAPRAQRLREEAERLRAEAKAQLAALPTHAPVALRQQAWRLEDRASARAREAQLEEIGTVQLLRAALNQVPDLPEATDRLADHYQAQLLQAEAARDEDAAAAAETLLRAYDRGRYAAWLQGDGALTLWTDPPGAAVHGFRVQRRDRRLVLEDQGLIGHTPLNDAPLPRGSWVLELRAPGHAAVRYPVCIGRQERWEGVPPGEAAPAALRLPNRDELREDEVLVPQGWFQAGGDPSALDPLPPRRLWVPGFIARRAPVTHAEFLAFLNALVAAGQAEQAAAFAPAADAGGEPLYAQRRDGLYHLPDPLSALVGGPDWPAMGLSWFAARAWTAWWAARDGRPWRLPHDLEWEKAARGVDGRFLPWGDFPEPSWAASADRGPGPASPCAVGSFAVDESPYGLRDLVGGVREWCLNTYLREGPPGDRVEATPPPDNDDAPRMVRGGAWLTRASRLASRFADRPAEAYTSLGLRAVRSWP